MGEEKEEKEEGYSPLPPSEEAALAELLGGISIHPPAQLYLKTHGYQESAALNADDRELVNKYLRILTPTGPGFLNWSPGNPGGGPHAHPAHGMHVCAVGWERTFDALIQDVMRAAAQDTTAETTDGGRWNPGALWTYTGEGTVARRALGQTLRDNIPMQEGAKFSTTFQLEGGPQKMITHNWVFSPESAAPQKIE
ncbi:unnamed protein product, partial [marine sediment metagenome]